MHGVPIVSCSCMCGRYASGEGFGWVDACGFCGAGNGTGRRRSRWNEFSVTHSSSQSGNGPGCGTGR
eukprot:3032133-Prorocentrum_lima.AAC.1